MAIGLGEVENKMHLSAAPLLRVALATVSTLFSFPRFSAWSMPSSSPGETGIQQ